MKGRVMCFGTFDIIHPGHIWFLNEAAQLGDELFVVVSRDDRRAKLTGKIPVHSQTERMIVLDALKKVTKTLPGSKNDILSAIRTFKPQTIALGHDQVYGIDVLTTWASAQKNPPRIVRLSPFKRSRHSTTRIKKTLCL